MPKSVCISYMSDGGGLAEGGYDAVALHGESGGWWRCSGQAVVPSPGHLRQGLTWSPHHLFVYT